MSGLPLNIPKRGLSADEAAEYCGVSRNTLAEHGPKPSKIGTRSVYDRRVLDRWLDELGGLNAATAAATDMTPEESLLEAINARKAALRHSPG
jgi:predicted DNA-binding transcriptional regulator AlpA